VLRGRAKPDEAHLVYALLADGPPGVMLDVGAHHGSSLGPFADAGWRVYAFEPDAKNRARLVEHYGAYKNVVIDARGIGEREARAVPFYRSELSTGISGLSKFHDSHVPAGTIDLTTVAAVCAAWRPPAIDFLKIDTEGFDLFVLRGVPWEHLAPRVIVCEFEDAKTVPLGYGFHDLARYLQQRGYRIVVSEWYPVERYGASHAWRRFSAYPCELADARAWGNLIATRDDVVFAALQARCARRAAR
jgi:FkbM family methyltransferase